ncbi:MAG TPA: hypothetical protein VGC44_05715 [Longimicrobiales bacterium]
MPKTLTILALGALLLGSANTTFAQQTSPRKIGWQVRVGAAAFSPLVDDKVRSRAVADSIDADASETVSVRQQIAPAIAVAGLFPLRDRTDLEVSAAVATSTAKGEDDFESWDVATVTVANVLLGISYDYRPNIAAHGGVGFTRLFGGGDGMFAEGNSIKPLIELGASVVMPFNPAARLDARVQTHRFATQSLRDEDAEEGSVFRVLLTGSYTIGRSTR